MNNYRRRSRATNRQGQAQRLRDGLDTLAVVGEQEAQDEDPAGDAEDAIRDVMPEALGGELAQEEADRDHRHADDDNATEPVPDDVEDIAERVRHLEHRMGGQAEQG